MMCRSLLFVPGDRSDRFDKALSAGADAVCIDLEDAVAPGKKATARRAVLEFLGEKKKNIPGLRINNLSTLEGLRDVLAIAESDVSPAFVMMPKVENATEIEQLRSVLQQSCPPIWPIIETPSALVQVSDIAKALGEEEVILFGGVDYATSLGADMGWDALYHARATIIAAAASANVQVMDVPFLDIHDIAGMREETCRVKAMGFSGRACIHPSQIGIINKCFSPSEKEIADAQRVVEAFEKAKGSATTLDGKFVDKPVIVAASRLLGFAKHHK